MLRIAIVEDEDAAAAVLERHLTQFLAERDETARVLRFTDAVMLLDHYVGYDLIFMDIEMPHMNGLEGARRLREVDERAKLIFVTNMAQYAAKGYEVDALDFIIKPVSYPDLSFKLRRAMTAIRRERGKELMIPQPGGMIRLGSEGLAYAEVSGHRLAYHLLDRTVETRGTMRDAETLLAGLCFLRPHNSYLVNPVYIDRVEGHTLTVAGTELPISHPRRKAFIEALTEWYAKGGV